MSILHYYSFLLLLVLLPADLISQEGYSLSSCIEYALDLNTNIKVAEDGEKLSELAESQARNTFIPSLALSNQHSVSTGRGLELESVISHEDD